jgi:hypothetical protein
MPVIAPYSPPVFPLAFNSKKKLSGKRCIEGSEASSVSMLSHSFRILKFLERRKLFKKGVRELYGLQ